MSTYDAYEENRAGDDSVSDFLTKSMNHWSSQREHPQGSDPNRFDKLHEVYRNLIGMVSQEVLENGRINSLRGQYIASAIESTVTKNERDVWVIDSKTMLFVASVIESFYHPHSAPTQKIPAINSATQQKAARALVTNLLPDEVDPLA